AAMPLGGVTRAAYDGYFGASTETAAQLEKMLDDPSSGVDAPAAIIVETVQGEGGLNVASARWLRAIERIARKQGALLIIDDIQAGCGRTGTFFSFEDAGVSPDIVTMAKSISGMGLPMALVLLKPELDRWAPGEHNGTFRGNCHAFVTARAAIETFWADSAFEEAVRRKSALLNARLADMAETHSVALGVKGRGMMQGLDVGDGDVSARIVRAAFELGLIIETSGPNDEIVKVLAPLTISEAEFTRGLGLLDRAVGRAMRVKSEYAA
ncbi:MAG: aminotransferase class III-fold pyridoxal phosphate-dependent enzyme, partial [Hyphomonadaceae bacterium]